MKETKIQWADHTWSPWRGCTKVSPGCAHCYAETLAKRFPGTLGQWGRGAPRVQSKNWTEPLKWTRDAGRGGVRRRVFPSMCDWLDDEVLMEWLLRFMDLILDTPSLDWLLLTKRPENWRKWFNCAPPRNVWFGVSVENQELAVERIPILLEIPAMIRWVSAEPLLGPTRLQSFAYGGFQHSPNCENENCALAGGPEDCSGIPIPSIDWLVIGGESGPGARGCNIEWVRALASEAKRGGVPYFVKQLGSRPFEQYDADFAPVNLRDPKGGDPSEWPEDLRVRELPR